MFTLNSARLMEGVGSQALTVCAPPLEIARVVKAVRLSKVPMVVPVYWTIEMVIRSTVPTLVVTVKLSVVAANRPDVVISNMSKAFSRVFFILISYWKC